MRIDECEVWITCEGQRLPEYDTQPEGDDGKTFACFIPSDAGKVSGAYRFLGVLSDGIEICLPPYRNSHWSGRVTQPAIPYSLRS